MLQLFQTSPGYTLEIIYSSSDLVPIIHLKMNPLSKKEARRSYFSVWVSCLFGQSKMFYQLRFPESVGGRCDCTPHRSAMEITFVPWSQTSRFVNNSQERLCFPREYCRGGPGHASGRDLGG